MPPTTIPLGCFRITWEIPDSVESTHVLSRKARAADAVATIATKHGVQLITGDSPMDVPVSPGGKAMMAAVLQFQRDRTHKHMTHQLEAMI